MKILKRFVLFILLPFLVLVYGSRVLMRVIHFIGHRDQRLGAYWKLRWIERFRRRLPVDINEAVYALLRFDPSGQKFEQILERCSDWGKIAPHEQAFRHFVAQQDYDKALDHAERWSALTAKIAEGKAEPMHAYFEKYGTGAMRDEITQQFYKEQMEFVEQSEDKRQTRYQISGAVGQQELKWRLFYFAFYKSQMAVAIMRWIAAQDAAQLEHVKAVFKDVCKLQFDWQVDFVIDKALAVRLGMSEADVVALHDSIVGAVNNEAAGVHEPEA